MGLQQVRPDLATEHAHIYIRLLRFYMRRQ